MILVALAGSIAAKAWIRSAHMPCFRQYFSRSRMEYPFRAPIRRLRSMTALSVIRRVSSNSFARHDKSMCAGVTMTQLP